MTDTDTSQTDLTRARDALLLGALHHVPFEGWSMTALRQGAEDAGMAAEEAVALFPHGAKDALAHFAEWTDRQMVERMGKHDLDAMRVRDRVALGVRTRLEILSPYKETLKKAIPNVIPASPTVFAKSADRIWDLAGDTATDFNYYSKRGLLMAVMAATTLFWLRDTSDQHAATWDFLDKRIDNVVSVGRNVGQCASKIGKAFEAPFRLFKRKSQV